MLDAKVDDVNITEDSLVMTTDDDSRQKTNKQLDSPKTSIDKSVDHLTLRATSTYVIRKKKLTVQVIIVHNGKPIDVH